MAESTRIDLDSGKDFLKRRLLKFLPEAGDLTTRVPGLTLYRRDAIVQPQPMVYKPVVILVAQGSKWVRLGVEEYIYGAGDCFIAGVDLPVSSCMRDITPERPFVSLALELDKSVIAQIAGEMPPTKHSDDFSFRGAMMHKIDADLLDAFLRLVELVDQPDAALPLSALISKEIHFRLLMGPFGHHLRSMHTFGSKSNQIVRAISWLRDNYADAVQVDDLARQVHMAPSTFHKHFKAITTFSPLQYQKQLRLAEAQRLMLVDNLDASQACLAVGYESQTQFNREYKRLYGAPPLRDVNRLRKDALIVPVASGHERRAEAFGS